MVENINGNWSSNQLKNGFTLTGNSTVAKQMPGNMGLQIAVITESVPDLPFYLAYKG
jgi:hypothetical protein